MSPTPLPVPVDSGSSLGLLIALVTALSAALVALGGVWVKVLRERHRNPLAELKWERKGHEDCRRRCAEKDERIAQLEKERADIAARLEHSYLQRIEQLQILVREQGRELGRSIPMKPRGAR